MKKGEKNKSNNSDLAGIFYEMAEILELKQVKWKPQAYIAAAQTMESLGEDVSEIYKKKGRNGLLELPGIGEALADKIIRYLGERKIDEYERLKKSVPAGLYEMMKIPGVGAKKAMLFYNKLGIKSIDELGRAAEEHKLLGLRGFKEKSEQKIIEGIEMMKGEQKRISLKDAERLAKPILAGLGKIKEIKETIVAGSFRRKKSSIRDFDIILMAEEKNHEKILNSFTKMSFVKEVLGKGREKATIITKDGIQVDARVFTDKEFGTGLLYFTGDKGHNIWLRKIAIKKGWKLNEYGLFDGKGKRIAGKNEEEVYNKLGLDYIEPEKRIGEVR